VTMLMPMHRPRRPPMAEKKSIHVWLTSVLNSMADVVCQQAFRQRKVYLNWNFRHN
jgi:hypothetical protein